MNWLVPSFSMLVLASSMDFFGKDFVNINILFLIMKNINID